MRVRHPILDPARQGMMRCQRRTVPSLNEFIEQPVLANADRPGEGNATSTIGVTLLDLNIAFGAN